MYDEIAEGPKENEPAGQAQAPAQPMIYCEYCGTRNLENNFRCAACKRILFDERRPVISTGNNSAPMRMVLPVGRSPLAIAAGYLGLVSVLIWPAPLAMITGILAVRDIRRHPEYRGMGRAVFGIVMGMIGTSLIIFGLLTALILSVQKRN